MAFGRVNLTGDARSDGAVFGPMAAIIGAIGTVVSAAGTIASGQAQKEADDFQAEQLDRKAQEEKAASQRQANDENTKTQLVLSRQQALAAGSGLDPTDPTILQLSGETARQGAYNTATVAYGGDQRAAGYRDQANASRFTGQSALTGSYFGAAGTLLSGASSFATKYGEGGFNGGGSSSLPYGGNMGGYG